MIGQNASSSTMKPKSASPRYSIVVVIVET